MILQKTELDNIIDSPPKLEIVETDPGRKIDSKRQTGRQEDCHQTESGDCHQAAPGVVVSISERGSVRKTVTVRGVEEIHGSIEA